MKKFLLFILTTILVFSLIFTVFSATPAIAATATSGTCGNNLRWSFNESTGNLTISGSGDMTDYNSSSATPWYSYRLKIKTVSLSNSLSRIGNNAFRSLPYLTGITIPSSVISIGEYAFSSSGLTTFKVGDGVISIEKSAFYRCEDMTDFEFNNSVTSIGISAFDQCDALSYIYLPDGITTIPGSLFSNCRNLTKIRIPPSVTEIGDYAFYCCGADTSMVFTLVVVSGSYAHQYAINKNISYILEAAKIISISVTSKPNKTVYPIGDILDTTGLQITATYSDGTKKIISSGYTLSSCDMSTAGTKTITVMYEGYTSSFTITVDANLVVYPESSHPYSNNMNQTWSYTDKTNADYLKITFSSQTETENNYDHICIYNSVGTLVGKYSGTQLAGKTIGVEGNSFTINLSSDASVTKYGFAITNVEAATRCEALGHNFNNSYSIDILPNEDSSGKISQHCINCEAKTNQKELPYLKIAYTAFTVDNELGIKCLVDKNLFTQSEYINPYVVFNIGNCGYTISEYTIDGDYYCFSLIGVDLNDTVNSTLYAYFDDSLLIGMTYNCIGDMDENNTVNMLDIIKLKNQLINTNIYNVSFDINLDNNLDSVDFIILRKYLFNTF